MVAYATVRDMIDRFGEVEMIHLTAKTGEPAETVDVNAVTTTIGDVSAIVDTYLRKRYQVPLDIVIPEINLGVCKLVRYELSQGEQKTPAEQTKVARDEVITWLKDVAAGRVELDLTEVDPGTDSWAEASTREPVFR